MLKRNKVAIVVVAAGIGVVSAYAIGTSDQVVARVLRGQLATYVRAPCTFESASFTFLHGLEVRGLTVLDPTDPLGRALLVAEHAHVDYKLDVTGAGPHMTGIEIVKPSVRLDRTASGAFPIQEAFFFPKPEGPSPPRPFVRLSGGEVTFADATLLAGEPLALKDIDVTVTPATPKSTDFAGAAIEMTASSDLLGLVTAHARVGETGTTARLELDLPRIPIDPSLPRRFAGETARRLAEMSPSGEVSARIKVRLEEGRDFAAEATVTVRGVSLRTAIPESAPGEPAPKALEVSELNGEVRFVPGRLEARNLSFRALGSVVEAEATLTDLATESPRIEARARVPDLALTREFLGHLPRVARHVADAYYVTGSVDAVATAAGLLSAPDVAVEAKISGGVFRYEGFVQEDGVRRGFPWTVESASGSVRVADGAIRIDAQGVHGPASVRATGVVTDDGRGGSVPDMRIEGENVPLDDDLRRAFGDRAPELFDRWGPSGVARRIDVRVSRFPEVDGDHDVTEVALGLDGGAAFRPHLLPVPLSGVTGKVEVLEPVVDGRRESLVRLTAIDAKGEGFAIQVDGEVKGSGEVQREDLDVHVTTRDAAGGFRDAAFAAPDSTLAPGVKDAVRKLGASGPVTIDAHLVKEASQVRRDVVKIALEGTAVTGWDDIPLAARALTGRVTLEADTLTFEDVSGNFVMGDLTPEFRGSGRLLGVSGDPEFDVHVESPEIPLGEPLRAALGPLAERAKQFWEEVRPVGTARASVVLDLRPSADPTPFEVTLSAIRGGLLPLGLELDNEDGTFHYDGRRVDLRLDSAIGGATVRIDEAVYDVATGRLSVRASVRNLRFPEDLEGPLSAETVARIAETAPGRLLHASDVHVVFEPDPAALEVAGLVSVRPRTRRAAPDPGLAPDGVLAVDRLVFWMLPDRPVFFQGEARTDSFALRAGISLEKVSGPVTASGTLGDAMRFDLTLDRASLRADGYPLDDVTATVSVLPRGTRVTVAGAKFMSGTLSGVFGPGDESVAYQGHATLADADLESILRFRAAPRKDVATGTLDASLRFSNATGARSDLRGEGEVSLRDGRLGPSPIFSAIWGLLSLGFGRQPELSEGRMKFDVEGEWLNVRELSVTGTGGAIEDGRGKIGLDGRLDLSVAPRLDLPVPLIRQILNLIQMPFVPRVRIGGTLRNPKVSYEYEIAPGGESDRRREPQPAGDVEGPEREPW